MAKTLFALLAALGLTTTTFCATIVVDLNGAGDFTEIQPAIDAAVDGDEVVVKPGEYVITESIDFNRLHDPEDPASPPVKNIVLRSQAGAEDTFVRMADEPIDPERASVVIFQNREDEVSRFEGFTLTGGTGTRWNEDLVHIGGGGVVCRGGSSPTLTSCTISGNWAKWNGGGVYCYSSSPTFTNCRISRNWAGGDGGGVACRGGSSATFTNCTVSDNSAGWGGGVHCESDASPSLTGCTISGNSAEFDCGGVLCLANCFPTLTDCTISGNSREGVRCMGTSLPTLTNCRISGNFDSGVRCEDNAFLTLTSCTISGNLDGGVYCRHEASVSLNNCTISGNLDTGVDCRKKASVSLSNCTISGNLGGGVNCEDCERLSVLTMTNCIVWDNAGGSLHAEGRCRHLSVTFSCVEDEDVWLGEGNTNANPLFCGWASGEVSVSDQQSFEEAVEGFALTLSGDSPCLGSGENKTDMGSMPRGCETPQNSTRVVRLAAGLYSIEGVHLAHGVSLVGAGQEDTVIEGTVQGLRTGAVLSDLSVTSGTRGGIVVAKGEAPEISECTIAGNPGGGVYCVEGSSPTLRRCTISGNSEIGGVYCDERSSPILANCTILGNWTTSYRGGTVECAENSSLTLTNCTISGNSVPENDRVVQCAEDSAATMNNCIVWANTSSRICGDLSHCLVDQDPHYLNDGLLDFTRIKTVEIGGEEYRLPDFVVEEPDYRLWPWSPGVDTGTPEDAPATDIEGNPRPSGCGVDMGAYEFQTEGCEPLPRFIRGDVYVDGENDLSDAVFTLGCLFLGDACPTCDDAADSNDDGALDLSDAVYSLGFLFLGGPAPESPFPLCGPDPTDDGLTCQSFSACQ